jgi:hypothetical protein
MARFSAGVGKCAGKPHEFFLLNVSLTKGVHNQLHRAFDEMFSPNRLVKMKDEIKEGE